MNKNTKRVMSGNTSDPTFEKAKSPSGIARVNLRYRIQRSVVAFIALVIILRVAKNLSQLHMDMFTQELSEVIPSAWENITSGTRADWAREDSLPEFCQRILKKPMPYNKFCTRDGRNMSCRNFNGATMMFSQFHQDFYLYTQHFIHKKTPGVYVDVASNEPIAISNTYFFDRCLGWKGVCVEANPEYYERIYRLRSCQLVPTCVGNRDGTYVEFLLKGGAGGVLGDTYKSLKRLDTANEKLNTLKERCTTMKFVLERQNIATIDYMSLDVEGHELPVLQGFDWSRVKVNVMTIEVSGHTLKGIEEFLTSVGYVRHIPLLDEKTKATGLLREDAIFLHNSVVFGSPE